MPAAPRRPFIVLRRRRLIASSFLVPRGSAWSRPVEPRRSRHSDHDTRRPAFFETRPPGRARSIRIGVPLGDRGTMVRSHFAERSHSRTQEAHEGLPDMETPSRDGESDAIAVEKEGNESALAGRRMVTAALLVAMTVTAMEQLVVSPAMPTIIAQLKGFDIYPWVISAYLLAATVSTPIYGKLADLYGRKRVLLFGLVLFSLGSILSGTSHIMGQLIAMRTIQGLGAGAVGPIVLTMLGDLFTLKERAQVQGLFSAVWGLSSVAGRSSGDIWPITSAGDGSSWSACRLPWWRS